jgi:hypothetical protein
VSLDYYVWAGPKLSADAFAARLVEMDELGRDELEMFEPNRRLGWFRREILANYPPLEVLPDDERSPWSMTPPESDRLIALTIHFPRRRNR